MALKENYAKNIQEVVWTLVFACYHFNSELLHGYFKYWARMFLISLEKTGLFRIKSIFLENNSVYGQMI